MGTEILRLGDVRRGDVGVAGGKGFSVPPGFVVPAWACEEFFQAIEERSTIMKQ